MNLLLDYKDPIMLVETGANGYGDEAVVHVEHLLGLFHEGMSQTQINYVDTAGTDAHVYLDIENDYVKENAFRLEGMYIIANLLGGPQKEAWYKISRVVVGQRKLLENDINNVHCYLTKCEALEFEES